MTQQKDTGYNQSVFLDPGSYQNWITSENARFFVWPRACANLLHCNECQAPLPARRWGFTCPQFSNLDLQLWLIRLSEASAIRRRQPRAPGDDSAFQLALCSAELASLSVGTETAHPLPQTGGDIARSVKKRQQLTWSSNKNKLEKEPGRQAVMGLTGPAIPETPASGDRWNVARTEEGKFRPDFSTKVRNSPLCVPILNRFPIPSLYIHF